MTPSTLPILLLALSSALSAPSALPSPYDGLTQVVVPQKRAALVLDRLLIALQKALHEDAASRERDGPRTAPLRIAGPGLEDPADLMALSEDAGVPVFARDFEFNPRAAPLRVPAVMPVIPDDTSALQRRGQGSGRGRVLRCYFNAVTCF